MLPVHPATVRLFLHVLAATVWVGGQLTLAGLMPGLRQLSSDSRRSLARRFSWIAWPAFGVLVATGLWNLAVVAPDWSSRYGTTLLVKLVVVGASGTTAFVHARARTPVGLATFGALSVTTAVSAVFLGVLLRT